MVVSSFFACEGSERLDDPQIPARGGLAQCDPGAAPSCPILAGFLQNLHHLVFIYLVP
jgi:hypothetical protein